MTDSKNGVLCVGETTQSQSYSMNQQEWREARLKALQRIEDLVAEAHGRKKPDGNQANDRDDVDSSPRSLRDSLKELADLSVIPLNSDDMEIEV